MAGLIPGTPGTTTRRDPDGNVVATWANPGITEVMWQDILGLESIMATPVEPVSQMWERMAASPPPSPWIPTTSPPVVGSLIFEGRKNLQQTSVSAQAGPSLPGVCDILALVPGLGAFLGVGCQLIQIQFLFNSVVRFFKSFKKVRFAIYLGRQVLTVLGQEALDEFMGGTNRHMRSKLRVRKSG